MKRWVRDVIYSVVLLVFCVVLWVNADGFVQNVIKIDLAKPSFYAHLWTAILGILALIQLIRAIVKRPDEKLPRIFTPLAVITLVSLVLYVATVHYLGFLLDTFLLMAILLISYSAAMGKIQLKNRKKGIPSILLYLAVAFVIAIAIQYLFTGLLHAKLPAGILF